MRMCVCVCVYEDADLLLLGLGLEDLLDDLLFFDKEGTHNTATDTVRATRTTISTADGLLVLAKVGQLAGANSLELVN